MVSGMGNNTLERKIYFYRAYIGTDEGGCPLNFDPKPALAKIGSLGFTDDDAGRYEFDADGNALCLINHPGNSNPTIRFCRVRRTGLPQIERRGNITNLNLAANTGLLEAVHVVFFPNNIVGSEYNHFGPRLSKLGNYLHEKSGKAIPRAIFRPILQGDAAKQLERLGEVRVLDMSIRPNFIKTVRQADESLGDAFNANAQVVDGLESVQLVIKLQKEGRQGALGRFISPLRTLLDGDKLRQNTDRLQLRGRCVDTDRVETIDLLKDRLISTKRIVRMNERSRALDPESAFQTIDQAYQELEKDIHAAPDISE